MKVDERVNIVYMIYKGDFLKLFPLKDGTHNWGSPEEALKTAKSKEDSLYLSNIIPVILGGIAIRQSCNGQTDFRFSERLSGKVFKVRSSFKIKNQCRTALL